MDAGVIAKESKVRLIYCGYSLVILSFTPVFSDSKMRFSVSLSYHRLVKCRLLGKDFKITENLVNRISSLKIKTV